jgi:hypothetical protein
MDGLQSIIKSLTKNEKRYFNIYSTAFKENTDLVKLFEVMDKLSEDEYNDEIATKQIGLKNITSAKSKLRKLLLKAIRNYREDHNPSDAVRCGLMEVEFLISKNLRIEARKELNKLLKFAAENELYYAVAELTARSYLLADTPKDMDKMLGYYDDTIGELSNAIEAVHEQYTSILYQSKYSRFFNFFNYDNPAKRADIVNQAIIETTAMLEKAKTPRGKLILRDSLAGQYQNRGDYEKSLALHGENFEHFLQNPELKNTNRSTYFASISNYIVAASNIFKFDLVESLIKDLEQSTIDSKEYYVHNPEMLMRVKNRIMAAKVSLFKNTKRHSELIAMEGDLDELLSMEDIPMQIALKNIMVLRYCGALLQAGEYDKTLQWIERYFTLSTAKQIKVNYFIIRFVEVMTYYELGQLDMAMTKAGNLYKSINDSEMNDPFMKLLNVFMRSVTKWNFKEKKDILEAENLVAEIENSQGINGPAGMFIEIFPFAEWLEKKTGKLKKAAG